MKDTKASLASCRKFILIAALVPVLIQNSGSVSIAQSEKGYLINAYYFGDIGVTARAGEEVEIRGVEERNGQQHFRLTVRGRQTQTTLLTSSVSRQDMRSHFRMTSPQMLDGYLVGGFGQSLSTEQVALRDVNGRDLRLQIRDIQSLEVSANTIVIRARGGEVYSAPIVYRAATDGPTSQTHQSPFHFVVGDKEIVLTELAGKVTMERLQ